MLKLTFLVFFYLLTLIIKSQILAIDYGTMYVKGALVHTGAGKAFSIVENPKSHRKFINSVPNQLFRWESIERKGFMRQILLPNVQEVHLIASFIQDCLLISIKILAHCKELRKS